MKTLHFGTGQKNCPPKRAATAATASNMTKVQLFKGVHNTDLLIAALRRKDGSYIRGAVKWLEKYPPNPIIVGFLKTAYSHFGYGSLSR